MPTRVRITRNRTSGYSRVPTPRGRHPKAKLITDDTTLVLPYAPRGAELAGWADSWEVLERPGRAPLVVRNGDGVATLALTVFLGHSDHQDSIEGTLAELRALARSGDRVTLGNLSVAERGPWRLEDVTVNVELRQAGTNHATRATVGLRFLAANDSRSRLGPVSGGRRRRRKRGKGPTRYHVRHGDTLASIADRFYGEPGEWRHIADRNNIRRPGRIKAGDVLVIPRERD